MDQFPAVFRWVLHASLMASILTVVIILLKYMSRNKFGIQWHYAVWFIVIIRLLLPFAPQSHISLFNLFVVVRGEIFEGEMRPQVSNVQFDDGMVDEDITGLRVRDGEKQRRMDDAASSVEGVVGIEEQLGDEAQQQYSIQNNVSVESQEGSPVIQKPVYSKRALLGSVKEHISGLEVYQAMYYLWLIGVILLGLYMLAGNIKLWQHLKRERANVRDEIIHILDECKSLLKIRQRVEVRYTDLVKVPVLFGLVTPKILIPNSIKQAITHSEIKHIFLHELAHLKRKDIIVNWLTNVLQVLHWFNPIIWLAFAKMCEDREVACDATVLYYLREDEKKKYGETLINILVKGSAPVKLSGVTGIVESKSQVKRRIKMIAGFNKKQYKWSLAAILVLLLMGCSLLTDPTRQNVNENGHNALDGETNVRAEDSYDIDNSVLYSYSVLADPVSEDNLENWFIKAGYITQQGEWVYFYGLPLDRKGGAYSLSSGPIYRIKLNGADKTKVVDGNVKYVGMYEDWLYYKEGNSLYRINVQSGDKALLAQNAYGSVAMDDEWIFVATRDGLLRMCHDGQGKELFVKGCVRDVLVHDGWVYYTTDDSLNRISVDGQQRSVLSKRTIGNIGIWKDKLYYSLVHEKVQTFQPQTYYEGLVMRIHDEPYIILDAEVYRMNLDGTGKEKVAEGNLGRIIDGWLISYLYEDFVGQVMVCRKQIEGDTKYLYHIKFLGELQDWNAIKLDPERFYQESRTEMFYKEFRMDGRWFYQWEGNRLVIRSLDRLKIFRIRQTEAGVIDEEQERHKIAVSLLNEEFYNNLKGISQDGNWIYYFNPYTGSLCRVSKDNTDNQLVLTADSGMDIIGVRDGWVYLATYDSYFFDYGIFKIKIDGEGEVQKVLDGYFFLPVIIDDWLYARYDGAFYRINLDTGEKMKLIDKCDSIFIRESNEWIYFTLDNQLYKIRRDGSGLFKLLEYNEDHITQVMECGEWIYYQTVSGTKTATERLYRIRQDGTHKKIIDSDANYYAIHGEWIYYSKGTEIYRMKLDGSQKAKVYENDNTIISVVGVTDEGIYFTEYVNTSKVGLFFAYSKLEFDNSNKVQIYNKYDFYKELESKGLATGVY
nr:hypothetical protein [Clostridia bacterium]